MVLATVNEATLVPFVAQQLNNLELALAIAKRGNLPGAEGLVGQQFERVFSEGRFKEAAELAAESPQVGDRSQAMEWPRSNMMCGEMVSIQGLGPHTHKREACSLASQTDARL